MRRVIAGGQINVDDIGVGRTEPPVGSASWRFSNGHFQRCDRIGISFFEKCGWAASAHA